MSSDRTIKNAFRLYDGNIVEGVLIPTDTRMTACVSSQVGCSLTCKFCATGRLERLRNLDADEIYDQVALIRRQSAERYQQPLSNIVFMGMGRAPLNYANVLRAIDRIGSQDGLGMAMKRITVSTAGIAKMIRKLGDDKVKFNLALSPARRERRQAGADHADQRHQQPRRPRGSPELLLRAHRFRVTFEYIVFNNFNDTLQDAHELLLYCRKVKAKVNIIEYNPIEGGEFSNAREDRFKAFIQYLLDNGVILNIRRSRGKDIDAACGQLANKNEGRW